MANFESFSVYDKIEGVPSAHCSSLMQLSNGDMLCAFYAGQYEKCPDVKIYLSRLKPEYQKFGTVAKWSEPKVVAYTPDQSSGSPVLYETPSQRLFLFWQSMHHDRLIKGGWSVCNIKYQISTDFGETWSNWKYLRRMWFMIMRSNPIITQSNTFIMPIHREFGKYNCQFYRSKDIELNTLPKIKRKIVSKNTGLLEPCIIQLNDGKLVCIMRSNPVKRIHIAFSTDDGLHWTTPKATQLPNPNSQVHGIILRNGNVLIAFNNQEKGRTNLSIAVSKDGCKSWTNIKTIFQHETKTYHYPSLYQTADGIIHLNYTDNRDRIGYCRFTEDLL